MIYQISSDNIEMSESMQVLTKEKFSRLESRVEQFDPDSVTLRVVINSVPEDKFEVKVVANINGKEYFTDESHSSLEHAIVECVSEVIRMVDKDQQKDWEEIRKAKGKV